MEVLDSPPGYMSQASLSAGLPQTPPYTPHTPRRAKHRFERSDSPASIASSIHPTETTSPPKKVTGSPAGDHLIVEELAEGDHDGNPENIVGPNEVEEVASDGPNDEIGEQSDHDPSPELRSDFEHLSLDGATDTADFDKRRKERRYSRRTTPHHGKRSRSPSRRQVIFGDYASPQYQHSHSRSPDSTEQRPQKRVREFNDINDINIIAEVRSSAPGPRRLAPAAEITHRRDDTSTRNKHSRRPTNSSDVAMETDSD